MFNKKILKNVVWGFISCVYPAILPLIFISYIIGKLGTDSYSLLVLSSIIISFMCLLDFGLSTANIKYISEDYHCQNFNSINKLIKTLLCSYLFLGLIGSILIILSNHLLVFSVFKVPTKIVYLAGQVLWLTAFLFPLTLFNWAFFAISTAFQLIEVYTKIRIFFLTFSTGLTVLVLFLGYGVKEIVVINILTEFLTSITFIVIYKKMFPEIRFFPFFHKEIFRKILSFSIYSFTESISYRVFANLDKFMLSSLISTSILPFYSIPYSIGEKIKSAILSTTLILFPIASELKAKDDQVRLKLYYQKASFYNFIVTISMILPLCVYANEILFYWLGSQFSLVSRLPMLILLTGYFIYCNSTIENYYYDGLGKPRFNALFNIIVTVTNFVLCFLLIPRYQIIGVAVAFLVPFVIFTPFYIYYFVKMMGIEFKLLFREIYLKVLYLLVISSLVMLLIKTFMPPKNLYSFLVTLALCFPVPVITGFLLKIFPKEDISIFSNILKNALKGNSN